jgi:hypothetical protein
MKTQIRPNPQRYSHNCGASRFCACHCHRVLPPPSPQPSTALELRAVAQESARVFSLSSSGGEGRGEEAAPHTFLNSMVPQPFLSAGTIQFKFVECGARTQWRPRFLLVLPTAVAVTKRFVQSETADGAPSPSGEGWGEGKGRVQLHHSGSGKESW